MTGLLSHSRRPLSALLWRAVALPLLMLVLSGACQKQAEQQASRPGDKQGKSVAAGAGAPTPVPPRPPRWSQVPPPGAGQTLALLPDGARIMPVAEARAAGLLSVDLSDSWAPFIFSESDGPEGAVKPNVYRKTFVDLASDRLDPEEATLG